MAKRGLAGLIAGTDGESLEQKADQLLAEAGFLGTECFSELQLTRIMVRQERPDSMERVWQSQVGKMEQCEIDSIFVESIWADIRAAAYKYRISEQTLEMVMLRQKRLTYADIATACKIANVDTVKKRIVRAQAKMMQMPEFGMWQTIMEMERCLKSQWMRMFWQEIELCKRRHSDREKKS